MKEQDEVKITIKLPKNLRDSFALACKSQDTTASRELRAHMSKYIKQHGQSKLF
jgi:hypothetical protein